METNSNLAKNITPSSNNEEEIDLNLIFNFLNRNKKFLGKTSLIFLILGYFYSFFPAKTWEGQFQIVLRTQEVVPNIAFDNPLINNFVSSKQTNNLKTEVGILRSPSVLMPAYQLINAEDNPSKINYQFLNWRNNLEIELEKGTSILNISYRDQNKDNILPVLEKMNSAYQEYSGIRKKRTLGTQQAYLSNQIEKYKKQSANSLKIAQEFAIDQDLMFFDNQTKNENALLPNNLMIENIRVQAANEIRKIDLELEKISKLTDINQLQYIGSTIPALEKSKLPQTLEEIETELAVARTIYKENDIKIVELLNERKLAVKLLKNKAIIILNDKKLETEAKMEAALRPKGILLKYKEFIRNASRDEKTLITLENELRLIELEQTKQEDPWELIIKPTLLRNPVNSPRQFILLGSLVLGLSLGLAFVFFKERKSGNIFELKELEKILNFEYYEKIIISTNKGKEEEIVFLREFISNQAKEKVNLIALGEINEEKLLIIKDILITKKETKKKIQFTNYFDNSIKENNLSSNLLLISKANVKYSDIEKFKKYMKLFKIQIWGIVLIDDK